MFVFEVLDILVAMDPLGVNYDKGKGWNQDFISVKMLLKYMKMETW